ncbi:ABC transporter ATP-binding protein [Halobaculum gomorrense]|uniref:Peptide/nickel transport system ATP-binding protein n=1 Tax=Halobaculum gomorrense TaxID=43928 RepID=A0A1M5TMH4_9EURY|nr:ABC transporter ATP-binding protein [Halobaculum gomorrense]SHH51914.1 peptide/nickel transport system ATP-binding protein [Halobaculum gomorrense]
MSEPASADGDDRARDASADAATAESGGDEPLLEVRGLRKYYYENDSLFDRLLGREPTSVKAVDGVDLEVYPGETLGVVGESGCGKSTTGETLLRLREATDGTVRFDGEDVMELSDDELTRFRKRAGIVFQDPFSSLDPRMTVGDIVSEGLKIHNLPEESPADGRSKREWRRDRARELLERVGLSADQIDRYPHEFSGGQRQRVGIARALALDPEFIVLDEPVSALDVSVQAQILNLLEDLQGEFGLTYLFIAHDLSVVRHICDRVAVMYLGEVVETGPTDDIFESPKHPYTEALLESVPRASVEEQGRRVDALSGDVPSPRNPPSGCHFRTRCPKVIQPATVDIPQEQYRGVMNLRDRLERQGFTAESVWETLESERDTVAFKEALREEFDLAGLSGATMDTVEDALEILANGREEEAADRLRDAFASPCEEEEPVLTGGEHAAACHLFADEEYDRDLDPDEVGNAMGGVAGVEMAGEPSPDGDTAAAGDSADATDSAESDDADGGAR